MKRILISIILGLNLLFSQENGEAYLVNHFNNSIFGEDVSFNDLAFTSNGLMYIASSKGIIEFDGKKGKIISIEKLRINSLVSDSSDNVYFISDTKFGFIKRDQYGITHTKIFNEEFNKQISDFRKIHITDKAIFFISSKHIINYNLATKKIRSINARKRILDSYLIENTIFIRSKERGLEKLINDNFITINDSEYFTSYSPVYNILKMDNKYLFSRLSKLYTLTGDKVEEFKTGSSNELRKHIIADGMTLHGNKIFVPTLTGGLFQIRKNGSLVKVYNKSNYLLDDNIINTRFDKKGNFWLIHKQNMTRLSVADQLIQVTENEGIKGKINDLVVFKSRIYLAGENGIFLRNRNGQYQNISSSNTTAWSFFKYQKKLFATTVSGIYEINGNKIKNISKLQGQRAVPSIRNSKLIYVASSIGLAYLVRKRRSYDVRIEKKIEEHIVDIKIQSRSIIWLNTSSSGVQKLVISKNGYVDRIERYDPIKELNQKRKASIDIIDQNVIYSSPKAFYLFNRDSNKFEKKTRLNKPFHVMPLRYAEGKDNHYAYTDLKKIYIHSPTAKTFPRFSDESITNLVSDQKSNFWVLSDSRVYRYEGSKKTDAKNKKLLIRNVNYKSNILDSIVSLNQGDYPELPYKNNFIRIDFSIPDFNEYEQYQYQYKINGVDEKWSRLSRDNFVELKNLSDDQYHILFRAQELRSSELFVNELKFIVLSPFWKAWWFYFLIIIVIIFILYLLVKIRIRAIEKRNKFLESLVNERTKELAEKNDTLNEALAELKETQVQLIHAEKMSSLGQMIAGIAHEMNTPLGSVKNNLFIINQITKSLFDSYKEKLGETYNSTNQILFGRIRDSETGVDRISEIVRGLRDFSKIDDVSFLESNVNTLIDETLRVAKSTLQEYKIEVEKSIPNDVQIFCNAAQVNQVFLNIIKNACQAMANVDQTKRKLVVSCRKESKIVTISIKDFGIGVPENIKEKIFDPFFTTREIGKGTGLGLATAYSIMREHQGKIYFESEVYVGTTFFIEFNTEILSTMKENLGLN